MRSHSFGHYSEQLREFSARRAAEALQTSALELQSSAIVVPQQPNGLLRQGPSQAARAAIDFPTALTLIVP